MLFKVNRVSDEYKGQFIEVEIGDDTNFVWLMIADGRETPTMLVGLEVRTVSDVVALALSMNIPIKING
nr:MAG TPA: hypothetical protein [Caudoviricetes sp.]